MCTAHKCMLLSTERMHKQVCVHAQKHKVLHTYTHAHTATHTAHSTQHTAHSTQHTAHSMQHTEVLLYYTTSTCACRHLRLQRIPSWKCRKELHQPSAPTATATLRALFVTVVNSNKQSTQLGTEGTLCHTPL